MYVNRHKHVMFDLIVILHKLSRLHAFCLPNNNHGYMGIHHNRDTQLESVPIEGVNDCLVS